MSLPLRAPYFNVLQTATMVSGQEGATPPDVVALTPLDGMQVGVTHINVDGTVSAQAAVLYTSQLGGTIKSNPFTTNEWGQIEFWVEAGIYLIETIDLQTPKRVPDRKISLGNALGFTAAPGSLQGQVTELVSNSNERVGELMLWWRPNNTVALPGASGLWKVCDGSVVQPANHDFYNSATPPVKLGAVTLPNLVSRVPFCVAATDIGSTGGANALNLTHDHSLTDHAHNLAGHLHGVENHQHGLYAKFAELQVFHENLGLSGRTNNAVAAGDTHYHDLGSNGQFNQDHVVSTLLHGAQEGDALWFLYHLHPAPETGGMTAGGNTGAPFGGTNNGNSGGMTVAHSTGPWAADTVDNRPAWIGLLPLMRVKRTGATLP